VNIDFIAKWHLARRLVQSTPIRSRAFSRASYRWIWARRARARVRPYVGFARIAASEGRGRSPADGLAPRTHHKARSASPTLEDTHAKFMARRGNADHLLQRRAADVATHFSLPVPVDYPRHQYSIGSPAPRGRRAPETRQVRQRQAWSGFVIRACGAVLDGCCFGSAGSCRTVTDWPARRWVSNGIRPSGNSSAS
jgi:hypothetical protein